MNGVTSRRSTRKWWAALAIVALAFLALRPACEVWLSHWDGHGGSAHAAVTAVSAANVSPHGSHDVPCCSSITSSSLVAPADSVLARFGQDKVPPAMLFAWTVTVPVATYVRRSLSAFVAPPGVPSFYERSARILR